MEDVRKHFKKDSFYQPAPHAKSFCGYGLTNIKKVKVLDVGYSYVKFRIEEVHVSDKYDSKSGTYISKGKEMSCFLSNIKQFSSWIEFDRSNHNSYSLTF